MGEISDEIKVAEEALARILKKMEEIPPKDRISASKYWLLRVEDIRQSVRNLQRQGFIYDLIYSQKKRKK